MFQGGWNWTWGFVGLSATSEVSTTCPKLYYFLVVPKLYVSRVPPTLEVPTYTAGDETIGTSDKCWKFWHQLSESNLLDSDPNSFDLVGNS
jgi:hypothetical protein